VEDDEQRSLIRHDPAQCGVKQQDSKPGDACQAHLASERGISLSTSSSNLARTPDIVIAAYEAGGVRSRLLVAWP
jgi:hypothetical protein